MIVSNNSIAGPRILTVDIETSPNLGYFFSLWNQNMGLSQVETFTEVISFAAKWHDRKKVMFKSVYHDGKDAMVQEAFDLLSAADIVVGYNSKGFDIKHFNREFLLSGLGVPTPFAQVDLMLEIKKNFRFASNKLDHVVQELGIGKKTPHTGFDLWLSCLKGDPKAWALMRKYNKHDVVITEQLYDALLPWITGHPHVGLYTGEENVCPNCGGDDRRRQGFALTTVGKFQRYQCSCGAWYRGNKRVDGVTTTGVKR